MRMCGYNIFQIAVYGCFFSHSLPCVAQGIGCGPEGFYSYSAQREMDEKLAGLPRGTIDYIKAEEKSLSYLSCSGDDKHLIASCRIFLCDLKDSYIRSKIEAPDYFYYVGLGHSFTGTGWERLRRLDKAEIEYKSAVSALRAALVISQTEGNLYQLEHYLGKLLKVQAKQGKRHDTLDTFHQWQARRKIPNTVHSRYDEVERTLLSVGVNPKEVYDPVVWKTVAKH